MVSKIDEVALAVKDPTPTKSTTAIGSKLVVYDDHIVNLILMLKHFPH